MDNCMATGFAPLGWCISLTGFGGLILRPWRPSLRCQSPERGRFPSQRLRCGEPIGVLPCSMFERRPLNRITGFNSGPEIPKFLTALRRKSFSSVLAVMTGNQDVVLQYRLYKFTNCGLRIFPP